MGGPNAGKTLLFLRLAAYCGVENIRLQLPVRPASSRPVAWEWSTTIYSHARARRELVGSRPHFTMTAQRLSVSLPERIWLVDTAGLPEGIHEEPMVREAAALTLRALPDAGIVLHLIDASRVGEGNPLGDLDRRLAAYASGLPAERYCVLANKIDRPRGHSGYEAIRRALPTHPVYPISAMTGWGFAEIKEFIAKHIPTSTPRQVI